MKIPVGILTYQRSAYLRKTLESFIKLNYDILENFIFCIYAQGIDISTRQVIKDFREYFDFIAMTHENVGCAGGFNFIMKECLAYKHPLIMHLQDDWLSTEPLTHYLGDILKTFREHKNVGYLRLRSIQEKVWHKNRITKKGFIRKSAFPEDKYCGVLVVQNQHFTLNPAIIRAELLEKMLPVEKEKDAMIKFESTGFLSAQCRGNCFRHIGEMRAFTEVRGKGKIWVK